jgi:ectoine hydroxylase-related dioxygenase (phytanoyl-CoA dioxygenase family)
MSSPSVASWCCGTWSRLTWWPPIWLPAPEQVTGAAGDLLLAHYLLGHNIGGNTSRAVRRAVYFRIKRAGHDPRWRESLQDPWLDYDSVRERVG